MAKDIPTQFKAKIAPALKSDNEQRELTGFVKNKIEDQEALLACLWPFCMGFNAEQDGVKQAEKHRGLALLYTLFSRAVALAAPTNQLGDFVLYVAARGNESRGGRKDTRQFQLPSKVDSKEYVVYQNRWNQLAEHERHHLMRKAQEKRQQVLDRRTLITEVINAYRKAEPQTQVPKLEQLYDFDIAPNTSRKNFDKVIEACSKAWLRFGGALDKLKPATEPQLKELDNAFAELRKLLLNAGDNPPVFYQLWKWIRDGRMRKERRGRFGEKEWTEVIQPIHNDLWRELYLEACYCAIRLAMGKWAMYHVQQAKGWCAEDRDFLLQAVNADDRANFAVRLKWSLDNNAQFDELNRIRRRMNRFATSTNMAHLDEFQTVALVNEIARIRKTNPALIETMVVQAASQWVAFRDKFRIGQTVLDSFTIVWSMETHTGPRVIVELVKFPWQPFAVTSEQLGDLVRNAVWQKMQELGAHFTAFLLVYLEVVGMVVDVITAGASGGLRHVAFQFIKERVKDKVTDEVLDAFHVKNPALRAVAGLGPNLVRTSTAKLPVDPSATRGTANVVDADARAVTNVPNVAQVEAKAITKTDVPHVVPTQTRGTPPIDRPWFAKDATATTTPPVRPKDQQVQQQMQRRDTSSVDAVSTHVPVDAGKRSKAAQVTEDTKVSGKDATLRKGTDAPNTGNRIQGPPTTPPTKTPPKKQPQTDLQDPHGNLTPDGAKWIKDNAPTVRHPDTGVKVDPKTLSADELNRAYRKSPDLIERLVITEIRAHWTGRAVKPTDFLYSNPKGSFDAFAMQLERRAKAAGLSVDKTVLNKSGAAFMDGHKDLRTTWNKASIELDDLLDKARKAREARGTPAARKKASEWEKHLEKCRDDLNKFERGAVGSKQPDAVEVLLGQSEVFVWDVTQQAGSAFHNFKTKFYGRVVEDLLGGKVKVKPAEYRAAQIQKELWEPAKYPGPDLAEPSKGSKGRRGK